MISRRTHRKSSRRCFSFLDALLSGRHNRQHRRRHLAATSAFHDGINLGRTLEVLEDRTLLTVNLLGVPNWTELGSSPHINAGSVSDPNNPASGAVEEIAIDPNNPARIFAGTVNGGIWVTNNGNRPFDGVDNDGLNGVDDAGEQPDWFPLTDDYASLAIGDIRFDPLDATGNTIFAGTGSTSSRSTGAGGLPIGVMRTTDAGNTWEVFAVNPGSESRIRAVLPTTFDADLGTAGVQQVVLVGTVSNTGLYRSIDGGETYTAISGTGGLPTGPVTDLIVDPNNPSRFFAGVVGDGVFLSDDGGVNWTPTDNASLTNAAGSTVIQLSAHPGGGATVLYSMVSGPTPTAYISNDGGTNWTALATIPAGFMSGFNGLYTSRAADQLIVDPSNSQIVYIAKGYGGSPAMYRYNPAGMGSWVLIESGGAAGNTRPHVDHRDLQFTVDDLGNDVLINANDGGIYFIEDPQNANVNRWTSLHGLGSTGLGVTEYTNVAWDSRFNVVTGGSQDNGTTVQNGFLDPVWTSYRGSDGGDVQVDTVNAGAGRVFRYSGTQNFNLQRHTFDSATNQPVGSVALVPAGGLANFNNYFVPLYELNAVDPSRLVTGGSGTSPVYELLNAATAPNAAGANWQAVTVGAGFGNVNSNDDAPFVYGGRLGGVDNPEVLIVGSGGNVFVRSTAGGTLTSTPTAFPGGTVQGIATDPQDWQHFFVADGTGVWETTDVGTSWTNLTRNLAGVNTRIQSVAFVPNVIGGVVVVGGNLGVSRLSLDSPGTMWSRFGGDLPNALVSDLEYNHTDNILVAGTFGRGAYTITNASVVVQIKGVLEINGDMAFAGQDDVILLERDANNPSRLNVFVNSFPSGQFEIDTIEQINVNGLGGNDTLIVDSTNGLIDINMGIRFDGDLGFDRLDVTQTDGTVRSSSSVLIGATNGSGQHELIDGGLTQTIDFTGLEPVVDNVPAAFFNISSVPALASLLQSANQVNYEVGQILGITAGRVTVDSFEPIEFENKTDVIFDIGAGDDVVNLNNANTPTGLTTITVNSGDGNDDVRVLNLPDSTAVGATFTWATVNGNFGNDIVDSSFLAVPTPMIISGHSGHDTLIGGRGDDVIDGGIGNDLLVGGDFSVTTNIGDNLYDGGTGFDTLLIRGTDGNDVIDAEQLTLATLDYSVNGALASDSFLANSIEEARIEAGSGDDAIRVAHDDALVATPDGSLRFTVVGDAPNASDHLIVEDDGLGDTVIHRLGPDDRSGSVTVGPLAPVVYEGIEYVTITPLDNITAATGADGEGQLVVFKHDPFESNNSFVNATFLGSGATINVDPDNRSRSRSQLRRRCRPGLVPVCAAETGTLDFQVFFEEIETLANGRAGLPGDGDIDITNLRQRRRSHRASSTSVTDNERATIPVVRNETYYMQVRGFVHAINVYNFTVINVPAPVPQLVDLTAATDSGRSDTDDITFFDANINGAAVFDIVLDDDRIDEFNNINLHPTPPTTTHRPPVSITASNSSTTASRSDSPTSVGGNTWRFTATAGDLNRRSQQLHQFGRLDSRRRQSFRYRSRRTFRAASGHARHDRTAGQHHRHRPGDFRHRRPRLSRHHRRPDHQRYRHRFLRQCRSRCDRSHVGRRRSDFARRD